MKRKSSSLPVEELISSKFLMISPFVRTKTDEKNQLDLTDAERKRWVELKTFFSHPRIQLTYPPQETKLYYSWKESKRFTSLSSRGLGHLIQGGENWHQRRKGNVTGSRLGNILGFWGIEGLIQCFYDIYMKIPNPRAQEEEEIQQVKREECVNWGSSYECHGASTFMNLFGEAFDLRAQESTLTDLTWPEELFALIKHLAIHKFKREWTEQEEILWKNWFRDSPDLQGTFVQLLKRWVLEIKCKYGLRCPSVYTEIPDYYIPQVQAHSLAIQTDGTYFLSWCPEYTRIWFVPQNLEFWKMAMENLMWFHLLGIAEPPVPPTALFNEDLTRKIRKHCQLLSKKAKLICCTRSIFSKETDVKDWE
jgi:hypothetical protein